MTDTDTDFGKLDSFRGDIAVPRSDVANLLRDIHTLNKEALRRELEIDRLKGQQQRLTEIISNLDTEVGKLQVLAAKTDKELDRWVQRGITTWALVMALVGFIQFVYPFIKAGAQ